MSAILCPFKPVKQREQAELVVHVHQFLVTIQLSDGTAVQDCGCGFRRRVQPGAQGDVLNVFDDGMIDGGTSIQNAVFQPDATGRMTDRWARIL